MKGHQYASLTRRIGTVIIAIGLALSTAALLAENVHVPQNQYPPFFPVPTQPAHTYDIVCCGSSFVTPKEFVSIAVGPLNSSSAIGVYLLKTNETYFQAWVSGNSSSPAYLYEEGNSSSFISYLSSHNGELIAEYTVLPRASFQTQFFPQDVEQLMVVLLNSGGSNATFLSSVFQNQIPIAPQLGFDSAAGFIVAGGALFAAGYVPARPKRARVEHATDTGGPS